MDGDVTLDTAGLDALIAGIDATVAATIDQATAEIATLMRSLVRVATGYTQSTITAHPAAPAGGVVSGEVTAGGAALFLELGHHAPNGRFVGPFPFALPAYNAVAPQVAERLAQRLTALAGRAGT